MRIRKAVPEDTAGIAKVHVDSWRSTYSGIISERFLEGMSYRERENRWHDIFDQAQPGSCVYVAEAENGEIVGFASGGSERSGKYGDFQSELYAIYLLKEIQGQGIGRSLFRKAARNLVEQGFSSMLVWVLADNREARAFYESFGPSRVDSQPIDIDGDRFEEVAYGWRNLRDVKVFHDKP
ncbi:MAG TPA: GNAT family N-acetyltransferase [Bacillales bacterium]|nr:GNAT family N-acetyltransferase [Bacillales bacterium]